MTQSKTAIKLEQSWLDILEEEFGKPYMLRLKEFLEEERKSGATVYPKGADIFRSMNETSFDNVRVVILGQDPYHGEGQANGLAFSVHKGIALPPSLMNIYKELDASFEKKMPRHGDLSAWARQGVLLLNTTLTVRHAAAGSHQKKGWEEFTDAIIRAVNDRHDHVVFMLWGSYAQKKGAFIDRERHLVLTSPHPSPLSAHRGFLGNGHFIKANEYLKANNRKPVDWQALD